MNISGIHQGMLRMYGGFIFKQWKKRFLLITAEGSLLVCHDASSPPSQLVLLQNSCEAIVEGKEILDLPKLPSGGGRDCCFALILPQNKYLLLLAETSAECSQWVNVLKKVKRSLSSPLSPCKRHQMPQPRITLQDLVPEQILDKDPPTPPVSDTESSSPGPMTGASPKEKGEHWCRNSSRTKYHKGSAYSAGCLRHGTINNAQAMKAVYLLMGGAAASSAMGYLGACSSSNLEAKAPDLPLNTDFSSIGPAGGYHTGTPALDSPHFNSFDFEVADSDFDAFDCGGFTF
ncbi:adhesion G-protein coupled receptor F3 [Sarotherodon galilaeus]